MTYTRFPTLPSNLPPDAVKWGKEVENVFNDILARLLTVESQLKAQGARR